MWYPTAAQAMVNNSAALLVTLWFLGVSSRPHQRPSNLLAPIAQPAPIHTGSTSLQSLGCHAGHRPDPSMGPSDHQLAPVTPCLWVMRCAPACLHFIGSATRMHCLCGRPVFQPCSSLGQGTPGRLRTGLCRHTQTQPPAGNWCGWRTAWPLHGYAWGLLEGLKLFRWGLQLHACVAGPAGLWRLCAWPSGAACHSILNAAWWDEPQKQAQSCCLSGSCGAASASLAERAGRLCWACAWRQQGSASAFRGQQSLAWSRTAAGRPRPRPPVGRHQRRTLCRVHWRLPLHRRSSTACLRLTRC
jgi:hypothetical protein